MRDKINQTLKEKDWSAKKLHEETGVRYQTVRDFLNKGKGIGHNNLQLICDCLGLELKEK